MHQVIAATLEHCILKIRAIQEAARLFVERPCLSLAQFSDYIFGSQFAVLYLFHNRSERKAQLRVRIH
jgi:hypothetical protein